MNDPTNSRYRYLDIKDAGIYRRFVQENKKLHQGVLVPQSNNIPAHGSYGALLFTPQWKIKRDEILKRDSYRCVMCHGKNGIKVHHRQYHFVVSRNEFKLPWEYPDNLLLTLCESCNKRGHSKYKVPTINI
ncbi:MAG: hypothetical protein ABI325_03345 [Ginsengibacter sp.]